MKYFRWTGWLILIVTAGCSQAPWQLADKPWLAHHDQDGRQQQMLSIARLAERHGQVEQAEQLYRTMVAQNTNAWEAHHRLGVLAARRRHFDEARQHFAAALAIQPENAQLLNDIGYAYYLQDDLSQAETHLRQALALNPYDRAAHNNLGLVLGEQGRMEECWREFQEGGSDAEAYANLAYVQVQNGDLAAARKSYLKALELDQSLRPAAEALVQLESHRREQDALDRREMIARAPQPQMMATVASRTEAPVAEMPQPEHAEPQPAAPIATPEETGVVTAGLADAELPPVFDGPVSQWPLVPTSYEQPATTETEEAPLPEQPEEAPLPTESDEQLLPASDPLALPDLPFPFVLDRQDAGTAPLPPEHVLDVISGTQVDQP